jgi:hypothetical protein
LKGKSEAEEIVVVAQRVKVGVESGDQIFAVTAG